MPRLVFLLLVSSLTINCASSPSTGQGSETGSDVVATTEQPSGESAASDPSVEPGDDWLFWAEGDVLVVDGTVWWTRDDLNEMLSRNPPRVPPEAREMAPDVARDVVNSYVAASLQVKANKALVDWHLDHTGTDATPEEAEAWYQAVNRLVAGPEERQLLARFAGRSEPIVNEKGMRRAARRNARLAKVMQASGIELADRDQAKKLYDARPRAWEVPGTWKVHVVECETVEDCEEFRASVIDQPDQFESVAARLDTDHGVVSFRAQAGTPARPLLNAFDSREPGTITSVVELGGAAWVGRLVEVEPAHLPDFEEVVDTIIANRRITALNQFEDRLVERLMAEYEPKINWDNVRYQAGGQTFALRPPRTDPSQEAQ